MNEPTEHEPYDFLAAAAVLTNEQRIVNAVEKLVELMTPKSAQAAAEPQKPSREQQIADLAAKAGTRRK